MGTDQILFNGFSGREQREDLPLFARLSRWIQPSFRFLAVFCSLSAVSAQVGCQYFYDSTGEEKLIPSPLPEMFPYEVTGRLYRVWVGNEIQIQSGEFTSYLLLQGVNNPDSGDEREQQAIDHLYALIGGQEIRAVIYERDNMQRGIAQVFAGDTNLNLEILANGWGQFDGSEFEGSPSFVDAQQQAKENKLGIWKVQ